MINLKLADNQLSITINAILLGIKYQAIYLIENKLFRSYEDFYCEELAELKDTFDALYMLVTYFKNNEPSSN